MIPKFIETLSGKLAERWVASVFAPACVFWLGGIYLRAIRLNWDPIQDLIALKQSEQLTYLVAGLLIIAVSGNLVQRFDLTILRVLEGYWPLFLKPLSQRLKQYHRQRRQRIRQRFIDLNQKGLVHLNNIQREELIKLDWQLMHMPAQDNLVLPTRLGNLLRAAEQKPYDRYGLDTLICWPHLWLLLPDSTKKELETARDTLNTMARIWLWCILFMVWSIWHPWVILVALCAAGFVYSQWIMPAAALYANLLEATFDLYRLELYKALRWPMPKSPADERTLGLQITEYLWRGSDDTQPMFTSNTSE